jgi:hypothetical protein
MFQMSEIREARDRIVAFANAHWRECAEELIEWQDTARLRDGKMRELAQLCEALEKSRSMAVAEAYARRAIFDAVVKMPQGSPSFVYEAEAKECGHNPKYPQLEKIGVWTDGLSISSEYEPGWRPAYRFVKGQKYRITIEKLST